jgi:hypothetical protein
MFFQKYYIDLSNESNINSISSYKNIMTKFINNYIDNNDEEKNVNNALMYSKYYLYYKIMNSIYDDSVMKIIYDYEYHNK